MENTFNFKRLTLFVIVSVFIFIVFSYAAFWFENDFRILFRSIYSLVSDGNIVFLIPRKHFHFPSGAFVSSFGIFMVIITWVIGVNFSSKKIWLLVLGLFLATIFLFGYSYVDGVLKIVVCTRCDDGIRQLSIFDLNYDFVFMVGLLLALLPLGYEFVIHRKTYLAKLY